MSYSVYMSIRIILEAPGLSLSAQVKDSALAELIHLVQENRDDSAPAAAPGTGPPRVSAVSLGPENTLLGDGRDSTKHDVKSLGAAELLNLLKKWDSFPEKIVLLGAWREAHGDGSPWRSADMDEAFRQAKESPPSNFPRDIRIAIKEGWIHAATPRTYTVTRSGWNRIGHAFAELQNESQVAKT